MKCNSISNLKATRQLRTLHYNLTDAVNVGELIYETD